jgi:tetratricopeptide (TPR) repeat protein
MSECRMQNAECRTDKRRSVFVCILHSAFCILLAACAHAPTPPPTPAAAPPPLLPPPTIEEVRAVRGDAVAYEQGLRALAPTDRRALALLGLFLVEQKRAAEAAPVLRDAAVAYPEVAPWLKLRVGDVAALTEIVQQTPASSAATIARLRLPALYAQPSPGPSDHPLGQAGEGQPAREGLEAALKDTESIPIDELTEEELVAMAKALPADLASQVRLRLLMQYPQGRFTEETYDFLGSALDALPLEEMLRIASQLGRFDRYDREFDLLRRIGARYPDAATSNEVRTIRYRALFNSRQYDRLLAETDPSALDDPAFILLRARAAWRAGKPKEFLAGIDRVTKEFPKSGEAVEASLQRAKYYSSDEPNYELAIFNLERAVDAGSIGGEGENLWTLGWTYFLAQRYDDALRTFKRYAVTFPDGDYLSNSLFWSAKIYERLGQRVERDAAFAELKAKYPYSWFSYRARELMGEPAIAPSQVMNGNFFPDIAGQLSSVSDPRLVSVRELAWLGLYRDATREMKVVAASYPDNLGVQFALADLYVQGGEPFKANGVLQRKFRQFVRHGGSNVPQRFWEILFPLNYWDAIRAEAERRQIDPYLVASIIRQESGFEPTTVSNAGAVGIMQIMPEEAGRIALAGALPPPTREELFDPRVNIAVGVAEYAQKLALLNGNHILAIAAYNAGTAPVGNWLAQTPVDDVDLFVETIPYAETRLYVKSVSRNRFEYRRIYEGTGSSSQQSKP